MKTLQPAILGTMILIAASRVTAQSGNGLDLSTRNTGVPPAHESVASVANWMQNPLDLKLSIVVTNLYASANDYMEIDIGGQREIFYGAGTDGLGNYIPTNYPPVIVNAVLRRQYNMSVMCPNSGPGYGPYFRVGDLNPNLFLPLLINATPDPVSRFVWTNFSTGIQYALTNQNTTYDIQRTNLTLGFNQVIGGPSIYNSNRFANVTLQPETTNLLFQVPPPVGQMLVQLNRLLIRDAYYSLYQLNVPENNNDKSGSASITFSVVPPPELKIAKNQPAPNYTVVLNGNNGSNAVLNLQNLGTGYVSMSNSVIELLKDKFGHVGLGDGCDDATKAPGQGIWLSMGPGCTQDTNRISLKWSVSLGRTFDGLAAGQLAFLQTELNRNSYTPSALFYNAAYTNIYAQMPLVPYSVVTNGGIVTTNCFIPTNLYASVILVTTNIPILMTNSSGVPYTNYDVQLRQVKATQTFVDILTPDTNRTVLNFYLASQVATNQDATGLFTNFSGNPFVVWTIRNPNPATTNTLLITEARLDGSGSTNSLGRTNSTGGVTWTLTQGTGPETRVETRQVSFSGSPASNRVEVDTVQYANSATAAYQCQETYQAFPWGWELKQTRIPSSPADLITTYDYYDNIHHPENYSTTGNGQLKDIIYPDGYWEKRVYEPISGMGYGFGMGGQYSNVLDFVFTPYMDGALGITSPDQAPSLSTSYASFYYSVNQHGLLLRETEQALGDNNSRQLITHLQGVESDVEDGPDGPTSVSESYSLGFGTADNYARFGAITCLYSDSAAPGLAGHVWFQGNLNGYRPSLFYYYDDGIFNTATNGFALDPNNHLYSIANQATRYPDHRQTMIYGNGYDGKISIPDDSYNSVEDHPNNLYLWYGCAISPAANITKRANSIYHGGNLVLAENCVYTGTPYRWALLNKTRYYVDSLGRATNVVLIDPVSSQTRVLYSADYRGTSGYDGALLLSETDDTGVKKTYAYDSLQRIKNVVVTGHGTQPNTTIQYGYDADGRTVCQTNTAGSLAQRQCWAYDLAGRLIDHVNQSGIETSVSYDSTGRITTSTAPGGITTIREQYLDRNPKSLHGSGVTPEYYSFSSRSYAYAAYNSVFLQIETTHQGSSASSRWVANYKDPYDLDAGTERPVGEGTPNSVVAFKLNYNYGELGSINSSQGFPTKVFQYDVFGNMNLDQTLPSAVTSDPYLTGPSRTALSDHYTIQIGNSWYNVVTNYTCLTDGSGAKTITKFHSEQLNGLPANVLYCAIDYDADTNETITTTYVDRADNIVTNVISKPNTSSLSATSIYQNGLIISSSTLSVAKPTQYSYDSLGRTNTVIDPQGNPPTSMTYDPNTGWMTSMTDPAGHTTSYAYYGVTETNAGKLKCQTDANLKKTYYAYTTQGQLYQTWGDVPYPAEYLYNEFGDLTNLVTFRGGSSWTSSSWPSNPGTGDNTYWSYDPVSGALLQKIDAQGNAVTYTYYPESGRLCTRSWQRSVGGVPVTVTNFYDTTVLNWWETIPHDDGSGFGDLVEQDYSDGTQDVRFNSYNRAGQPREIIDAAGISELTYDYASRLVSTTYAASGWRWGFGMGGLINCPFSGITVSNHFNPYFGRDVLKVSSTNGWSLEDDYGYDSGSGRLAWVGSGNYTAYYGYVPNSDLLQSTMFQNGGNTVLTTTRSWDYGFRLRSIANVVNGAPVTSHTYQYDAVNRRTRATLEDNSYWQYGYNDRNELTGAQRHWYDSAWVSGQQFGYAYDNIGNRQTASFGGDTGGNNLQTVSYTANSLNQYASIVTPGQKDICGAALVTNSVTVNSVAADRKWEYYHRQISIANTNQPVWQGVTVNSGSFSTQGGSAFPANNQTLAYDADGNLTFDGVWNYQWDGENRLISMNMTNVANIANTNRLRLDFAYDFMGRRMQKVVSTWGSTNFVAQSTNRFVYDGWNLLAIINPQSSILQSFVWGNDLSGTMTRAGGVGGLLMASLAGTNCFTAFDGNGNITALINAADKSLAARYEYSPYHETLRSTGPLAHLNPFRSSTKYSDDESGLIYYGGRYYDPTLGRWLNHDPATNHIILHLYLFCHNNSLNRFDLDGKDDFTMPSVMIGVSEGASIDAYSTPWIAEGVIQLTTMLGSALNSTTAYVCAYAATAGLIVNEDPDLLYNAASVAFGFSTEGPEVGNEFYFSMGELLNLASEEENNPNATKGMSDAMVDYFSDPNSP